MNKCLTCGCELESKLKSYCKTCGDKRTKINQQKYRDKLKYDKEHFLTQIELKGKKLCNTIPKKEEVILVIKDDRYDLANYASIEDMIDIQNIIKQVKKGIVKIEKVYEKYSCEYNIDCLKKYIRRCI